MAKKPLPSWVSYLIASALAVLVFVFFIAPRMADSMYGGTARGDQQARGVTLAAYQRLETGMSYLQAVEVLGAPGVEMSSSEMAGIRTVMYKWDGSGDLGANMNAMFQTDRLVTKAQFGLR